jgi:hypothetical protein
MRVIVQMLQENVAPERLREAALAALAEED